MMPLAGRHIEVRVQVVYAMDPPQPWRFVFCEVNEIAGEAIDSDTTAHTSPQWHSELIEQPNARSARPYGGGNG